MLAVQLMPAAAVPCIAAASKAGGCHDLSIILLLRLRQCNK
jgi:hypothetical protein